MNGATEQLKALFGWTTNDMAELYVQTANRARLAKSAAHLLLSDDRQENEACKSIPSLPVR
jgi:hypothetical protein